jgi:hypothetical protein
VAIASNASALIAIHTTALPSRRPQDARHADAEKTVLLTLAAPIDQRRQAEFLQEVAAELEATRQAGEIGEGAVHRLARTIQRKYWHRRSSAKANRRGELERLSRQAAETRFAMHCEAVVVSLHID